MSRTYTDAEKQLILDRLAANNGDLMLTASQTGISDRTLSRWRRKFILTPPPPPSPPLPPQNIPPATIPTDPDLITALTEIQQEMLTNTRLLSKSIPEAIAEAPLNQRILALVQLIDRIVKLNAQLPTESIQIVVKGSEGEEPDGEPRTDSDDPTSGTEESNQL